MACLKSNNFLLSYHFQHVFTCFKDDLNIIIKILWSQHLPLFTSFVEIIFKFLYWKNCSQRKENEKKRGKLISNLTDTWSNFTRGSVLNFNPMPIFIFLFQHLVSNSARETWDHVNFSLLNNYKSALSFKIRTWIFIAKIKQSKYLVHTKRFISSKWKK